jgi:TIR domain
LAEDIEALGHIVWFDKELRDGQTWWDQILTKVRNCDVFIFALDPMALSSTACKREYGYAADLGKPILPVLAAEGVSTSLLPPALSQIQFVDYRKQDRDAFHRLARAIKTLPPAKPFPEPLPLPPEVPISYLGRLAEQIETTPTLSFEQQSGLVADLKNSLRDPEIADDAYALLAKLRRRRDLFATIAEEIDELVRNIRKVPEEPKRDAQQHEKARSDVPAEPEKKSPGTQRNQHPSIQQSLTEASRSATPCQRMIAAPFGGLLGTTFGLAMELWMYGVSHAWVLLPGAGGAIAGALSGTHKQGLVKVGVGAALGWFLMAIVYALPGYALPAWKP